MRGISQTGAGEPVFPGSGKRCHHHGAALPAPGPAPQPGFGKWPKGKGRGLPSHLLQATREPLDQGSGREDKPPGVQGWEGGEEPVPTAAVSLCPLGPHKDPSQGLKSETFHQSRCSPHVCVGTWK